MRYIDCEVNDEYVIGSGVVIGAAGSHNDVGLRLKFGDMWVGLNIYATFTDANGEKSAVVMLMPSMLVPGEVMTYILPIPADAKKYPGKAMLTLSGFSVINGTQVDKATNTVTSFFRVLKSDYRLLTDSSVTPTLAQQLHSEVNSLGERIEETETDIADIREDMADIEDKIDKIQVPDSNIPEWALQPNKPSYSKEEVGLANVDNVRQYSENNPPPYPVTSVNGQAGDVSLRASDVGAMPADTKIPAKTSDITNDSGFITKVVSDLANYYPKSQTFTRDEINAKISAIPKFAIEVVSSLPTSNISETTVYLVGGGSGNNLYTEYIYVNGKWEFLAAQTVDLTGYATETWVITQLGAYIKQSELDAAINSALASIPDWAKSSEKPTYGKSEVGLGNVDNVRQYSASNPPPYPVTSVNGQTGEVTVTVPSKTSDLTNDSGFIKSNEAPVQSVNGKKGDVTLSAGDVGARPSTWTPTYSDVGADKSGTASSAVSSHNTNTSAHNDIRLELQRLAAIIVDLLDSDDETLDEMHEVVAIIKENKALIEVITTSKVSVADIVNNLTTNVTNKPLSAAQGVALKALIDAITIPTKLSQLTGDSSHRTVTDAEKTMWNAKIGQSDLQDATDAALAQAKESGEFDGADGRGIKTVSRTSGNGAAGTTDTYTITYTDNTTSTFLVYNGKNGTNGTNGTNGKTPVKGTDYFTPAEKTEMVNSVIAALPKYAGEVS